MRIGGETNHAWPSATPAPTSASPAKTAASLAAARSSGADHSLAAGDGGAIDFNSATRQELFDWMNEQILSGKMSLYESTPFLGMTLKMSAATGRHVDMATDTTRIDFMQKARDGIEGALWRSDEEAAERLRAALHTMQRLQNGSSGVDFFA